MAYTLDFTAFVHRRRHRWFVGWIVFSCMLLGGIGYGVYIGWQQWQQPTLYNRLSSYQSWANQAEDLLSTWEEASTQYAAVAPWYRLFWSDGVTNALHQIQRGVTELPSTLMPGTWTLETGGECVLTYTLRFTEGGRRAQLETAREALLSLFAKWNPVVSDVTGDLAARGEVPLTVRFSLGGRSDPMPPPTDGLRQVAAQVQSDRQAVMGYPLVKARPSWWPAFLGEQRQAQTVGQAIDSAWMTLPEAQREEGRLLVRRMVDPASTLQGIARLWEQAGRPVPGSVRTVQEQWRQIADRRLPWTRIELDRQRMADDLLVEQIRHLIMEELPAHQRVEAFRERTVRLRAALLTGLCEAQVFDEGEAVRCLERSGRSLPAQSWRVEVSRAPFDQDLMIAPWVITVRGAQRQAGGNPDLFYLENVTPCLEQISVERGFMIRRIEIQVGGRDVTGYRIEQAVIEGLVPVRRASVDEPAEQG